MKIEIANIPYHPRSIDTVFVPLIIIGIVVTWVFGTLALFGFKITLLTGLLPPIIVVIGIPNCVYMLNYYHFSIEQLTVNFHSKWRIPNE